MLIFPVDKSIAMAAFGCLWLFVARAFNLAQRHDWLAFVQALAAAERLKQIFPSAIAEGIELQIPMPGHSAAGTPRLTSASRAHTRSRG